MSTLIDLPKDCIVEIISHLPVCDMISLVQVSKHLSFINNQIGSTLKQRELYVINSLCQHNKITSIKHVNTSTHFVMMQMMSTEQLYELLGSKEHSNPLEELNLLLVKKIPHFLADMKNPSKEIQLRIVKKSGLYIKNIKKPSVEVQLAAVKENGRAIKYINDPSNEVQLAAVKQNWDAIECIKNPSLEVQLEAVKRCGKAICFIKDPPYEVQLEAIKQNWKLIIYITNPSDKVLLYLYDLSKTNIDVRNDIIKYSYRLAYII